VIFDDDEVVEDEEETVTERKRIRNGSPDRERAYQFSLQPKRPTNDLSSPNNRPVSLVCPLP
jgi:hypothetical protein